jgi:hypothetical protein
MHLFEAVADRPIKETPITRICCPWCGGFQSHSDGLVERDEIPDKPTRVRQRFVCGACKKPFVRESIGGNYWYHDGDGLLLRGMPDRIEGYRLTCLRCAARVRPEFDEELIRRFVSTPYGPSVTTSTVVTVTVRCPECGHGGEIDVR